jgi:hypothetical protein
MNDEILFEMEIVGLTVLLLHSYRISARYWQNSSVRLASKM